ncbi:hypothetical protein Agub_g3282 [Astrephomene gubernaculifera]|uniref:Deoxyhypusine monooxygenase n=1 Tax=Astrephomene gubernaculifera TaxID=47775 RepID=A0AAD3HIX1_9CHLO|nr:hypothetical protein Agub_g3282 [Astrephomene gubernaculifera]
MTAPPLVEVDESVVLDLKQKLLDPKTTLPEKYRVLFSLRNVKGAAAHDALELALKDESALFRHDVAFCLGQRQDTRAISVLTNILHNTEEHPMVRHEAGEALGAIATDECLPPLRDHEEDQVLEVAETCQLALQRIEYLRAHPEASNEESPYYSVDPTPALPAGTPTEELRAILLDERKRMFDRYSALFALRNKGGKDAVSALGAVFGARSALLKHEVAYVMGQMQDAQAVQYLTDVLKGSFPSPSPSQPLPPELHRACHGAPRGGRGARCHRRQRHCGVAARLCGRPGAHRGAQLRGGAGCAGLRAERADGVRG